MANPDGVPVLQDNDVFFENTEPVFEDGFDLPDVSSFVQWGIFNGDGTPVIVGDSVLAFQYARDSNISMYPVEDGGFAAYNKVQTPFGVRFSFTKGGTDSERTDFLNDVKIAQDTLELFQGITSDKSYSNITIDHVDYRKTSRHGVQLLIVDVWCVEVRQAPPLQFSNSNSTEAATDPAPIVSAIEPQANNSINNGTVQGIAPTPQRALNEQRFLIDAPLPGSVVVTGGDRGSLVSPATITAPLISLTNSVGNIAPPAIATAVRSQITYGTVNSPASALVSGVLRGALNQTIGYVTNSGLSVSVNVVQHIIPPGFTVVQ